MPKRHGLSLLLLASGGLGCGTAVNTPGSSELVLPVDPYIVALGTAQDGGLPQLGSDHPLDLEARDDPTRRRLVASLLLVDPRSGRRWLFDATPDIREQVELARVHAPPATARGRPPLFDGIFLTHAHVGHYLGLAHLGREAYGARLQPVHASRRMCDFLSTHAPWELLVRLEHIELRPLAPDVPLSLAEDLTVTAFVVPHREEYSDTFGYRIEGPARSLLYIPDIDKWERWERPIETELARVDAAWLDGTFYANGEIPGRDMAQIPHPFIEESMRRFAALPAAERAKVAFIHLNHSNPAADPDGPARREVERHGCRLVEERELYPL